jgi:hypothetical protein
MDRRYHITGILLIALLLSAGCKREEFSWGQKIGDLTFSGNVVFLGSEELSLISEVADDRISFYGETEKLGSVSDMSILVLGVSEKTPYGLLRKVRSVEKIDHNLIILTSDASLTDAVKDGTIQFKGKLLERDFSLLSKRDGVLVKSSSKSFDGLAVTLDSLEVWREGASSALLGGSVGISPEVEITIKISSNRITQVSVSTVLDKIDELNFRSVGTITGATDIIAADFIHTPVVIDSLVFVPYIRILCGMNVRVAGSISSGFRQDRVISSGSNFQGSAWTESPIVQSINYDFSKPEVTDSASVKVFSGPEISILLFGVPVQVIRSTGYVTLEAKNEVSLSWSLSAGNSGFSTVKADMLGLGEDHSQDLEIAPIEIPGPGK